MFKVEKKFKKCNEVFLEKINEDENIAINVATGVFVSVDSIGLNILNYIEEPRCVGDIIQMIDEEYDCTEDITNDIIEFINMSIEAGFVEQI